MGSITPPEPSRIRSVRAPIAASRTAGEPLAMPGHRMVLGHPEPLIAQLLDLDRALDGMLEGNGLGMTMTGARTIEQGEPHAVINAAGHEELPGFGVENLSLPR